MKRTVFLLAVLLFLGVLACPTLAAAENPDRMLIITVKNPPPGEYYLDLLIDGTVVGMANWGEGYNPQMIASLQSLKTENEYPAMAYRRSQLRGDLRGTPDAQGTVHVFSELALTNTFWKNTSLGLPAVFKIVIVTEELGIVVSESVNIELFQTKVTYDFETGKIVKQSTALTMLYIYGVLLLSALAVELALMLPFKINLRKAWKGVAATNVCSVLIVTVTIGWTLAAIGIPWAQTEYPLIYIWMAIFETIVLVKLLGNIGFWRKVLYGLTANLVSGVIVYMLIGTIMGYA